MGDYPYDWYTFILSQTTEGDAKVAKC